MTFAPEAANKNLNTMKTYSPITVHIGVPSPVDGDDTPTSSFAYLLRSRYSGSGGENLYTNQGEYEICSILGAEKSVILPDWDLSDCILIAGSECKIMIGRITAFSLSGVTASSLFGSVFTAEIAQMGIMGNRGANLLPAILAARRDKENCDWHTLDGAYRSIIDQSSDVRVDVPDTAHVSGTDFEGTWREYRQRHEDAAALGIIRSAMRQRAVPAEITERIEREIIETPEAATDTTIYYYLTATGHKEILYHGPSGEESKFLSQIWEPQMALITGKSHQAPEA